MNNKIINKGSSTIKELKYICKDLNINPNIGLSINKKNDMNIILINPPNGHWIAIYKKYYFDSFGIPPSEELQIKNKHIKYYNDIQLQDLNDSHCGHYCCYWLYCMKNNLDFFKNFKNKYI